ncbi:MAG: hypothetical protein EOP85_11475 [Verrucomicrobiaceae bacterium]|nr:MAG: hypothetical protein EOP85_11475 [Verrucomicrobiaceae bacterium]
MTDDFKPLPTLALAAAAASMAHAQTDTRLPVISQVEVKYSLVSHYSHVSDRVAFYNQSGQPQGNTNYAVPHLVYEPVVTLYNPYNTPLTLQRCRVRISNPPVGFKFRKNEDYLRPEWNNGGPFLGLGRFQIANESNPAVQKTITLLLRGPGRDLIAPPNRPIVLQPGEALPFAVWVEPHWTWGDETGYSPRAFFDIGSFDDVTNRDKRSANLFGVETVSGQNIGSNIYAHDFRAGFQTDNLSVSSGRPAATRYPFETDFYFFSWVCIKLQDHFRVEARGVDTVQDPAVPDYQLSLMGGKVQDPVADTLKSYSFTIDDLDQPATETPQSPVINRVFSIGELLQGPTDSTSGGKTTFASFKMAARSSALQQKKFQLITQPPANELYETRLEERVSFHAPGQFSGPSDYPRDGIMVTGVERVGDLLMLDVAAAPLRSPSLWKIIGGSDLAVPLADDLTSRSIVREGPEGAGIYKLTIPVPPGSEKYFVQIGL